MIKYVHGSEDSLDRDVFCVFDEMPSFKECQEFCASKEENRNIIVIKNGIVKNCFKGTPDEINNGLYFTYNNHEQQYPLLINRLVERDSLIKGIRVLRCLLSHCSRTQYREQIKQVMSSYNWKNRIQLAKSIDYVNIEDYDKNGGLKDTLKIFAFQLIQSLELFKSNEIFTKSTAAELYPALRKYLYREENVPRGHLVNLINYYLDYLDAIIVEQHDDFCYFEEFNCLIDLKTGNQIG